MKRLIILLSLALLALGAQAQNSKLIVRNFTKSDIGDMRARTSPVFSSPHTIT